MGDILTHSPGPWRCDPIPEHAHTDPDINVDNDSVFWISEDRVAGEVLALVQVVGEHNPGDAEANGRLMAAAAALLDAAKVIVLTPHICAYLKANDPKALLQLTSAIQQAVA